MKYTTLNENLRYIKKVLRKPYSIFTFSPKNTALIILTVEDKKGIRLQFTGASIWAAVEEAYLYVTNEIKAGSLKDIEVKKEELQVQDESIIEEQEEKKEFKKDNKKKNENK